VHYDAIGILNERKGEATVIRDKLGWPRVPKIARQVADANAQVALFRYPPDDCRCIAGGTAGR
jgi:hypothetical protein